jgi:hypothetical protein
MSGTALVVGVGRFAGTTPVDAEAPVGAVTFQPLEFVYDLLPRVADSLSSLGYSTIQTVDPDDGELRRAIEDSLNGGCRIVHVMSHGATDQHGDPNRVDIVPASGSVGIGTNVSEWVSAAQTRGRPTLFLLDLCRSGRAARLPFLLQHAGRDTYAWVLAASGVDEDAYDGRFSSAVADVLDELSRTGFGADPTRRYVAFSVMARHVRKRV